VLPEENTETVAKTSVKVIATSLKFPSTPKYNEVSKQFVRFVVRQRHNSAETKISPLWHIHRHRYKLRCTQWRCMGKWMCRSTHS